MKITSELPGQTTKFSKPGRLITVILSHIDRYVGGVAVCSAMKSGTAEVRTFVSYKRQRFFCFSMLVRLILQIFSLQEEKKMRVLEKILSLIHI